MRHEADRPTIRYHYDGNKLRVSGQCEIESKCKKEALGAALASPREVTRHVAALYRGWRACYPHYDQDVQTFYF